MTKKIKLGTIKVTRKVVVKQHVQTRQSYNMETKFEPTLVSDTNSSNVNQPIKEIQKEVNKISAANKKESSMHAKLPSGVYPQNVEFLYSEFDKRRIPKEQEDNAMYDVFISHAYEDKKDFVNPLVEALQDEGIRVWYDTLEMQWGKSIREQIDNGIKRSKFAILVLSKNFFAKKWPQRELDGILAKQEITGATPLPIWYNLSFEDVYEFSPTLTGIYSLSTASCSIEDICKALKLLLGKEEIKGL